MVIVYPKILKSLKIEGLAIEYYDCVCVIKIAGYDNAKPTVFIFIAFAAKLG
jgi:hypothetical protein